MVDSKFTLCLATWPFGVPNVNEGLPPTVREAAIGLRATDAEGRPTMAKKSKKDKKKDKKGKKK